MRRVADAGSKPNESRALSPASPAPGPVQSLSSSFADLEAVRERPGGSKSLQWGKPMGSLLIFSVIWDR